MTDIDYTKITCEKCGAKGVVEEAMDVFVACLCTACYERLWNEYVEAVSQPDIHQSHIPNVYRPPQGLPLRWQDEQSGVLKASIRAYLDAALAKSEMADREQFLLVREWLSYYISAPCWSRIETNEEHDHLAQLKASILTLSTRSELSAWTWECLDLGIDPL